MVAKKAPIICDEIKPNMFDGFMPVNVSVRDLAIVIAGLAKDVDDVKKYAEPMYKPVSYTHLTLPTKRIV